MGDTTTRKKRKYDTLLSPGTTKGLSFSPWWDNRKKELSSLLSFGNSSKTNTNLSWIKKSETTPSYPDITIHSSFTEEKKIVVHTNNLSKQEIGEDEVIRSLKVRIKPTKEQKEKFHKIFGVTRFVYNKAVDWVNQGHKPAFKKLKSILLNKDKNPEADQYPWLFTDEISRDAKDMAIHELCAAIASTKESLKAKKQKIVFEMKNRTRKDPFQRFKIPNNGGNPGVRWDSSGFIFWPRKKIGTVLPHSIKDFEKVKLLCGDEGCMKTVTLKYESPGNWFMIFPYTRKKASISDIKRPVIALDPGIRTFQAGYSSLGKFSEYGSGDINRIFAYGKKMDKLQSKIDKCYEKQYGDYQYKIKQKRQRRKWRKILSCMNNKIQNWMRDVHWKMSRDLTQNNDHILISRFKGCIENHAHQVYSFEK